MSASLPSTGFKLDQRRRVQKSRSHIPKSLLSLLTPGLGKTISGSLCVCKSPFTEWNQNAWSLLWGMRSQVGKCFEQLKGEACNTSLYYLREWGRVRRSTGSQSWPCFEHDADGRAFFFTFPALMGSVFCQGCIIYEECSVVRCENCPRVTVGQG